MQENINENNEKIEEKSFFHLFRADINELWNYFLNPSFIPAYFHENCKMTNIKNFDKRLKEKDILEFFHYDKNVKVKLLIEKIIDTQNFKSVTYRLIEHPDDMYSFIGIFSFYFCSLTHMTGFNLKLIIFDKTKSNFMTEYFFKNEDMIYKSIEKYSEINFKETEQTESIGIRKSGNEVLDFLTTNNYTNLKILLGNKGSVKPTNNPNEIEVEHFTKNNKVKFAISKNKEFNEMQLIFKIIESTIKTPRQIMILNIININKDNCLVMFTHKIKEYVSNDIINNYSILKRKVLWLLKSTIEE